MRRTISVALLFLLLSLPLLAAGQGPMKEGLWEITTTMDMPGMPVKMPPTTITHCYTKEELKDSQKVVPKQQENCKITDLKQSGSRTTWKTVCTGKKPSKGEGEIVFKGGTSYEGSMKFSTEGMVMTSKYKARRIGDCK